MNIDDIRCVGEIIQNFEETDQSLNSALASAKNVILNQHQIFLSFKTLGDMIALGKDHFSDDELAVAVTNLISFILDDLKSSKSLLEASKGVMHQQQEMQEVISKLKDIRSVLTFEV